MPRFLVSFEIADTIEVDAKNEDAALRKVGRAMSTGQLAGYCASCGTATHTAVCAEEQEAPDVAEW